MAWGDLPVSIRGSRRQRGRRKEVAGPYRSQSSVPKIRKAATKQEHRSVAPSAPKTLSSALRGPSTNPLALGPHTSGPAVPGTGPALPSLLGLSKEQSDTLQQQGVKASSLKAMLKGIEDGRHAPSTVEILAVAAALSPIGPEALIAKLGASGLERLVPVAARAIRASEEAAAEGGAAAARTGVRGAARRAVAKAEPKAVTAARQAAGRRATQIAEKTPASIRTGAKVAGRAASYPVRHPIQSPFAAQVPAAAIHRDPSEFGKALSGTGTYAAIANDVAGSVGGLPGEAISLPAAVLPSAFLAGKAGVSAAQGNPKELDALIKEWRATGVLPSLAEGNLDKAAKNLSAHPLYGLLEGSGAVAAAGRTAGAVTRAATRDRVGGLSRPDLTVRGTGVNVKRRYSRDLTRQSVQRLFDRTRGNELAADTHRGRRYLKEAANRHESNQEAIRRDHARSDIKALKKILPTKGALRRLDRKSADVVNLAVERLIQHPETFSSDLTHYKAMLETAAKELGPNGKPRLNKAERASNAALLQQVDRALQRANPEHVVESANAFIELQRPILKELVDLKLLTPDQAEHAAATSFARVHLGADYVEGVGKVDRHGDPLPLEKIHAEMDRRGIERPGFLSHQQPSNADFYKPSFGGAMLDKGVRTGESVVRGGQQGGIEALVRQLRRSRGLVDRAKSWNGAVTRFGIEVHGVKTWGDAKRVLQDPARHGLDPAIQPVAVPRHPFFAKKNEIEGALEHQDPALADDAASGILADSLDEALKGKLDDGTPIVFMPGKVAEQLRESATPAGPGLRGAQAVTTAFKRAVLPFSPGFYIGNGFDNALRTALAGVNPAHFLIGRAAERALTAEERASLGAGAHFASVDALAPHRSVESLVRGYDPVSKTVRQAAEWSRQHGWKQAAVKFAPKMLAQTSHYLLALNAYITEVLPQRGAIGKIALAEFRETQKSWVSALTHQRELAESFAKGVKDPDKMIQLQKDLEAIYGNYTRMSPAARKVLSTITPFWTWMRAAYKFVYLTMPAHHSIQTGLLAAAANATLAEREHYGLDKQGERPLPDYLQGALPMPGGGIIPFSNYNSFGYASDPLEAISKVAAPQIRNELEALAGRDWKGEPIPGGEGNQITAALWAFATSFVPGANLFVHEKEGHKYFQPELALPEEKDRGYVEYAREPKQTITVPDGGGGGGSAPWRSGQSSGSGEAPWKASGSSSGGGAPWK